MKSAAAVAGARQGFWDGRRPCVGTLVAVKEPTPGTGPAAGPLFGCDWRSGLSFFGRATPFRRDPAGRLHFLEQPVAEAAGRPSVAKRVRRRRRGTSARSVCRTGDSESGVVFGPKTWGSRTGGQLRRSADLTTRVDNFVISSVGSTRRTRRTSSPSRRGERSTPFKARAVRHGFKSREVKLSQSAFCQGLHRTPPRGHAASGP